MEYLVFPIKTITLSQNGCEMKSSNTTKNKNSVYLFLVI